MWRINRALWWLMKEILKKILQPFLFRLANKQDKMNALLGSELIEILSLEKLVNQSRSLCHIVSNAPKFPNAN